VAESGRQVAPCESCCGKPILEGRKERGKRSLSSRQVQKPPPKPPPGDPSAVFLAKRGKPPPQKSQGNVITTNLPKGTGSNARGRKGARHPGRGPYLSFQREEKDAYSWERKEVGTYLFLDRLKWGYLSRKTPPPEGGRGPYKVIVAVSTPDKLKTSGCEGGGKRFADKEQT